MGKKCKITPLLSTLVFVTLLFMLYDIHTGFSKKEHFNGNNSRKRCSGHVCDPVDGTHKCVFKMNKKGVFARTCELKNDN